MNKTFVECIEDHKLERYGFLWLKKRKTKIEGLTNGKQYQVFAYRVREYNHPISPTVFSYYLILNDDNYFQLYPEDLFKKEV